MISEDAKAMTRAIYNLNDTLKELVKTVRGIEGTIDDTVERTLDSEGCVWVKMGNTVNILGEINV